MRRMWVIFCGLYVCKTATAVSFNTFGAPVCGYGQYRQDSRCYSYGVINDTNCSGRNVTGNNCLTQFVNDSSTIGAVSPFSVSFSKIGAPIKTYATMRTNKCLGTMDGYYAVDMNKFSVLNNYECSTATTPYEILNECQNIDMSIMDASDIRSPLNPDNFICGVLCENGAGYTDSGACAQYCTVDGKIRNFHILFGNTHVELPLYSEPLTTPAIHIRFSKNSVCHMNLSTQPIFNTININYEGIKYYGTK